MTFNDLKINDIFTVYKKISSKRYEEKKAVVKERNDNFVLFNILKSNGQLSFCNGEPDEYLVKDEELNSNNCCYGFYYLVKPQKVAIVKKKTLTKIEIVY